MLVSKTVRYYNEMGDGFDEVMLLADDDGRNVSIIDVGLYAGNEPQDFGTTVPRLTGKLNQKGYIV